ncbi:MAG: bifunctional diaminohydroxyphosphoribosylaminopyrimidine deaminase/5-amino-6-(5-phosphoribosylamino)uracil reductase RibD [Bacteroidota bacterium]
MIDPNIYMQRAFELAELGKGSVSPNPLVGCVIVYEDQIIGEGFHQKYGEGHAEVNAVNAVKDKSLLKKSDVFVTLEPCSHHGKTPPCADMLISHQVKKVWVANLDPNPLVSGRGMKKLEQAGIETETGVLADLGEEVNRRFFTFMRKKRPHIILKWAETADGFVARKNYNSKWISNPYSRQLVHKLRAEEDAILVGTNTARYDNPQLNVRDWKGNNPLRIVIDKTLSLPENLKLFTDGFPTICYNQLKNESHGAVTFHQLEEDDFAEAIMADLYQRKVQSVIIEGGSRLLTSFMEKGLWDEAMIFKSKNVFKEGISSPTSTIDKDLLMQPEDRTDVQGDTLIMIKNK